MLIVGYQATGTPGRALVDGAKTFRMGGEAIAVKATIHTLGGFSAHASQSQLFNWLTCFSAPHPKLYLVHGEAEAKMAFREHVASEGWSAAIPQYGESISI